MAKQAIINNSPTCMIRKVVRVTTNKEQPSDFSYWKDRPISERINAIEMLRQSYLNFKKNVKPGLQRVCRVTQQS